MCPFLPAAAAILLAAHAAAQTTVLTEDFNAGVVPPIGWTQINNGNSVGWRADSSGSMAMHSDERGWNDNVLLTPSMDLSALSQVFLHGVQGQNFAAWRDQNLIEVSLDGGLTFENLYEEQAPDGQGIGFEVDLSAYAGAPGLQIGWRYLGNYANEWFLDQISVDDIAPPPAAPHWANLPSEFTSAVAWLEDFDSVTAGSLPPYMAVNALHSYTRLPDADGWCNVGQVQGSAGAYSSPNALEMGLVPGSQNHHQVSNALVIGLNGAGVEDFTFSFHARQFGEESSADDGIWLSLDGLNWTSVLSDWVSITGGTSNQSNWRTISTDLAASGLDLSSDFYLAIAQEDNYPYKDQDGVAVDQLAMDRPVVDLIDLIVAQTATLTIYNVEPYSLIVPLRSSSKGLTQTAYGTLHLAMPFDSLGILAADASGVAQAQFNVPFFAEGMTFFIQALELNGLEARFSNLLIEKVTK